MKSKNIKGIIIGVLEETKHERETCGKGLLRTGGLLGFEFDELGLMHGPYRLHQRIHKLCQRFDG